VFCSSDLNGGNVSDPNGSNMVDPRVTSENLEAEQRRQSIGSLIIWLAISIVCMVMIYVLFRIVSGSF